VTVTTEWVEDAAMGVAVREVEGDLHMRPLYRHGKLGTRAFWDAVHNLKIARADSLTFYVIDSAHRLAFARALSPIAGPGKRDSDAAWVMYMGLVGADGDNLLAECLALAGSAVLA